jgi:protein-arginine kinase activator protein McsA
MKCENCQSEMSQIAFNGAIQTYWCSECGTLAYKNTWAGQEADFHKPNSVNKIKELVTELIKAKDKSDASTQKFNRIEKDNYDQMSDWGNSDDRGN